MHLPTSMHCRDQAAESAAAKRQPAETRSKAGRARGSGVDAAVDAMTEAANAPGTPSQVLFGESPARRPPPPPPPIMRASTQVGVSHHSSTYLLIYTGVSLAHLVYTHRLRSLHGRLCIVVPT